MLIRKVLGPFVGVVLAVASVAVNGALAERAEAPATSSARTTSKQLVAGSFFTCSLAAAGNIRCWGDNDHGQLGNGSTNAAGETASVAVLGITNATEITAGAYHACALLSDGRVKCWGYGLYGQLGNGEKGPSADTSTPVFVKNSAGTGDLTNVTSVSAGYDFTCALLVDTTVKCWGQTSGGKLGNGEISGGEGSWTPLPVDVKTNASTVLSGAAEISTGSGTGCALLSGGSIKCWGNNYYGQLGIGNTTNSAYAVSFGSVTSAVGIASGGSHECAITATNVQCAGGASNKYVFGSQLSAQTPLVIAESNVKQVVASDSATCILRSDSTVACAGGIYTFEDVTTTAVSGSGAGPTSTFTVIAGLTAVVGLAAGSEHFCASLMTGMKCWGKNSKGQLGNGVAGAVSTPVDVVGLEPTTISIDDPGAKNVDSAPFDLSGTASSGTSVAFSVADDSVSVCSVSMGRLTVLGAGSCSVNGTSLPSGIYAGGIGSRTISISALAPTVAAGTSSAMTLTGATVSASVNAKGASTSLTLEYGTDPTLATKTSVAVSGTKTGITASAASRALTDLSPGTTYYFRFKATNSIGTTIGAIASFGTNGAKPTVTTGTATPTAFGASIAADVNANDVDTTVTFEYGTDATLSTSQTVSVDKSVTGATATASTATLSKLSPGTTYYYRVVGVNSVGTSRGDIKSFTTKGVKPVGQSGSATPTATRVTLNGRVNPGDLETTITFEYGVDAKLAGSTSTAAQVKSGSEDIDVSAVITNLEERTTYYYRIVATNLVGTAKGDIKSFSTTRPEGVSVNNGDEFTSSQSVTVSVVGPSTAVKAILSNDGGFATSETFDLVNNAADIPWTLQSSKEGTFTKIVYVKYVSRFGSTSTPYTDDIILDTTKPTLSTATAAAASPSGDAVQVARVSLKASAKGGVRLSVRGSDTISGVGSVEVRSSASKATTTVKLKSVAGKADGKSRPMSQTISLKSTAKRLQVRVIDRAGNASAWRSIIVK